MSIPGQLNSDSKCPLADNFSSVVLGRCTCLAKAKLKVTLSMKFKFDWSATTILPLAHGKDVFVQMSTGGGKSLCMYLFPLALNDSAMGLIISPLVALLRVLYRTFLVGVGKFFLCCCLA